MSHDRATCRACAWDRWLARRFRAFARWIDKPAHESVRVEVTNMTPYPIDVIATISETK